MARVRCMFVAVGLAIAVVASLTGPCRAFSPEGPLQGGTPVPNGLAAPPSSAARGTPSGPNLFAGLNMSTQTILERAGEWLPSVSAGFGSAGVNGKRRGSNTVGTVGLGLEKGLVYGGRIGYPSPISGISVTGYWFRSRFSGGSNSFTESDGVFFHEGDDVRAELNIKVKVLTADLDPSSLKPNLPRGFTMGLRLQGAWYDDEFRVDNLTNQERGLQPSAQRNRRVVMFGYGLFAKLDMSPFFRRLVDDGYVRFLPWAKVAVSTGRSPDMSYRGHEFQVRLMESSDRAFQLKHITPQVRADLIYSAWQFRENLDRALPVAAGTERIDDVDLSLLQVMVSLSAKFDWQGLISHMR
ncbi:MAG: hypothetical protein AB1646_13665 [Thermodesulfobacteriota bacterium]